MTEDYKNKEEETVNIKEVLLKYSRYWYYFLLCTLFFLFCAFLFNRYATPIYSASTTILIRDDSNSSLGAENLLEGLELFSGKKNLKNEIGILESFDLVSKTIQDLGFQTSYFHLGNIRTAEVYRNVPFFVNIDSSKTQSLGIAFNIYVLSDNTFEITTKATNIRQYQPKQKTFTKQTKVSFKYDQKHTFGEKIETDHFAFTIEKQAIFDSTFIDKEYYFVFHDITNFTNKQVKKFVSWPNR